MTRSDMQHRALILLGVLFAGTVMIGLVGPRGWTARAIAAPAQAGGLASMTVALVNGSAGDIPATIAPLWTWSAREGRTRHLWQDCGSIAVFRYSAIAGVIIEAEAAVDVPSGLCGELGLPPEVSPVDFLKALSSHLGDVPPYFAMGGGGVILLATSDRTIQILIIRHPGRLFARSQMLEQFLRDALDRTSAAP